MSKKTGGALVVALALWSDEKKVRPELAALLAVFPPPERVRRRSPQPLLIRLLRDDARELLPAVRHVLSGVGEHLGERGLLGPGGDRSRQHERCAPRQDGLLVVVIVVLFLTNLRAATITLTAIPLSLAAAVLVLRGFDATINTMTLGGMAIAIGALVDDAIIGVENVVRRLRDNAARPPAEQRSTAVVVRDATLEIRTSIVFATIIIALVFLPMFGLSGIEGRLLAPLAGAYIVAILASLAVAMIVTPALSFAFLPGAQSIVRGHDGWLARTLKARFARVLPRALDHPRLVMLTSAALLLIAVAAMTRMGTAFLPEFNEGTLTIQANTMPGTSLQKSDEIGRQVEEILLAQPEVVSTARRTGRAEYDEHVQGVEAAEIDVGLRETGRSRADLLAELRQRFSTLPGTNVTIGQPISHRIDHMLSGTRANIAVKIFGDDLPMLRRLGERVRT